MKISPTADAGLVNVFLQDASGRTVSTLTVNFDVCEVNPVKGNRCLQRGIYLIFLNSQTIRCGKE